VRRPNFIDLESENQAFLLSQSKKVEDHKGSL